MKPIRLKITGLNSFIQTQSIDFELLGRDNLFCISGNTGSGKTTIVDAIILALYGATKRGNLEDTINLSCPKAVVELTIELEGEVYIIVREIRRKSGNVARLFKGNGEIIADGIKSVDAFIVSKIGLEREQFTKVVMLQQGEFDKFLSDNRNDRMKVIEKLTDIGNYKKAVEYINFDEKTAKAELENCKMIIDTYADVSDEILQEKNSELESISKHSSELVKEKEKQLKALDELKKKLADYKLFVERENKILLAKNELNEIEKEYIKLNDDKQNADTYRIKLDKINSDIVKNRTKREEMSGYLASASSVGDLTENINRAINEYKRTSTDKTAKENELNKVREKIGEIKQEFGFDEAKAKEIDEVENLAYTEIYSAYSKQRVLKNNLLSTQREYKECEEKIKIKGEIAKLTELEKNVKSQDEEKCKQAVEQAELLLDKMRSDNALGIVLSSSKIGDVCPVCGNVITSLNHIDAGGEIAEATELVKKAKAEYENAQRQYTKSQQAHATAITEYNAVKENLKTLQTRIDEIKKSIGEEITEALLKEKENKSKVAKNFAVLVTQLKTLTDVVLDKEMDLKKRKEEGDALRKQQTELVALLEEKCGTADKTEIKQIIDSLRIEDESLEKERQKTEEFLRELLNREIKLTEKKKHKLEIYESLNKEHTYCEKVDQSLVDKAQNELKKTEEEIVQAVSKTSALTTRIKDMEKRLEAKKTLEKEYKVDEERYSNLKELKELVKGSAFTDFVADAFIEEITDEASERMSDLSSSQYTLYYDGGAFFVRDAFGLGEGRNVSTLSGGEKFLASLSLAIAISRRAALSKDYGFFFIDEGFGTLDDSSLETVCASLEKLAEDTVVGVITHRTELIERIPSVLKVEKADGERGSICSIKQ